MSYRIVDGEAVVSDDYCYLEMKDCPLHVKCTLLTVGGVAITGKINSAKEKYFYDGWAPLPRKKK